MLQRCECCIETVPALVSMLSGRSDRLLILSASFQAQSCQHCSVSWVARPPYCLWHYMLLSFSGQQRHCCLHHVSCWQAASHLKRSNFLGGQ